MSEDVHVSESPPSTYPIDSDPSNWNSCGIESSEPQNLKVWGRLFPLCAIKNTGVVDLEHDSYTFGRLSSCDVVFSRNMTNDHLQLVSKIHFKITRKQLASVFVVYLEDLSSNGTFVNSRKVGKGRKVPLVNNDLISLAMPPIKVFAFTNCLREQNSQYPEEVLKKYTITMELGAGSCGAVRLAFDKSSGKAFAMKIIRKSAYSNGGLNDPSKIMNEIKILKSLSHPCVIRIEDFFDTPGDCFIVLTLAEGGDLMKCILELQHLSEKESKQIFYQIVLAVQYLHSKGITHRDLKPQNILLVSQGPNSLIKVADFGLSKSLERSQIGIDLPCSGSSQNSENFRVDIMKTICGSPLYVAPEILASNCSNTVGYTRMVDIWSMGVILYVCLSGSPPFLPSSSYEDQDISDSSTLGEGSTRSCSKRRTLQSAILAGDYCFPKRLWGHVTGNSIDLIKGMMTVDPNQRFTHDQILAHLWMQDEEMKFQVHRLMTMHKKRYLRESCGNSGSTSDCTHQPQKRERCLDY
ncbi:ovarian-specific serine/threonine-protein kinase Lok-like [Ischnura elegans]|uniref:ovarian-specific serine/threonine-protein kinase Lok-like n=1 Tax=Ischnura elegans TaxID=197161 RepID=UPI001ED880E9|nr:ovarian-specific serine/threonine-protein kinase Lok-like [Ischnura elegans]